MRMEKGDQKKSVPVCNYFFFFSFLFSSFFLYFYLANALRDVPKCKDH